MAFLRPQLVQVRNVTSSFLYFWPPTSKTSPSTSSSEVPRGAVVRAGAFGGMLLPVCSEVFLVYYTHTPPVRKRPVTWSWVPSRIVEVSLTIVVTATSAIAMASRLLAKTQVSQTFYGVLAVATLIGQWLISLNSIPSNCWFARQSSTWSQRHQCCSTEPKIVRERLIDFATPRAPRTPCSSWCRAR